MTQQTSTKVSVLIPVYNRQEFVAECIQSALDQTYDNIEIVVVDNASTDKTWEVCQEYALKDDRVHVFRNESNLGPVLNWRCCASKATGEFAKLHFSDDLLHPNFIEKTIDYLRSSTVAFVFTKVVTGEQPWAGHDLFDIRKNGGVYDSIDYINLIASRELFLFSPCCALFRLQDMKNYLNITIPSPTINDFMMHGAGPDVLLMLEAAQNYEKIAFVDHPLVYFREHKGSISVSSKYEHLMSCYRQTVIYFLLKYKHFNALNYYIVAEWLAHVKSERSYINLEKFLREYDSTFTLEYHTVLHNFMILLGRRINKLLHMGYASRNK